MEKKYYKLINLGMLPFDILVCQGMSTNELRDYIKKKYKVIIMPGSLEDEAFEHHDSRQGKTIHLGNHQTLLWLKWPPTSPSAIATLAHESFHAINYVAQTAGIDFHNSSEEFFTYGMEYIIEEVLKDFRKK